MWGGNEAWREVFMAIERQQSCCLISLEEPTIDMLLGQAFGGFTMLCE